MKLNEFYAAVDGNYEDAMERLQNEMFVGKFLRMLPRDGSMMLLEKAMADGRANDAFRAVHTLKGIAPNLSLTKLAAACSQLTEALRGADTIPQQARELLIPGGRLYEQREAAVQAIRQFDCLSVVKNTAAFYIFPRINLQKCPITDDKKFAMDLLHAKHILLVPGSGFDWPQPDHFRVVMLPEAKDLARAMTDVGEFLQTYRQ